MSASTDRINAVVPRLLPFLIGVIAVSAGYWWLVQPRLADYRRIRAEAETLETRVRVLESAVARGQEATWPDQAQALDLFEQRVSKEDRVADIVERLARAVAESAADGKLSNLAMAAGEQVAAGMSGEELPAATGAVDTIDPRWGLFPYTLTHTPVSMSFDASYGTIASFFSKIRDLPTAIEIRSVKLTRGLPLMSVELIIFVFRRGDLLPDVDAVGPFQPASSAPRLPEPEAPSANRFVPRVIEPRGPGD